MKDPQGKTWQDFNDMQFASADNIPQYPRGFIKRLLGVNPHSMNGADYAP